MKSVHTRVFFVIPTWWNCLEITKLNRPEYPMCNPIIITPCIQNCYESSLLWRHMAMVSQITEYSTICSTVFSDQQQKDHQTPHYWSLLSRIHWWLVDSPYIGPVMRKAFNVTTSSCSLKQILKVLWNCWWWLQYILPHNIKYQCTWDLTLYSLRVHEVIIDERCNPSKGLYHAVICFKNFICTEVSFTNMD